MSFYDENDYEFDYGRIVGDSEEFNYEDVDYEPT